MGLDPLGIGVSIATNLATDILKAAQLLRSLLDVSLGAILSKNNSPRAPLAHTILLSTRSVEHWLSSKW